MFNSSHPQSDTGQQKTYVNNQYLFFHVIVNPCYANLLKQIYKFIIQLISREQIKYFPTRK